MTLPFDDEAVARVAAARDMSEASLRAAADDVQSTLADHPGRTVDGLVYEWRQAFRDDPLVERRPDAWVLRVPERVWADVRERAGVEDAAAGALEALHATGGEPAADEPDEDSGQQHADRDDQRDSSDPQQDHSDDQRDRQDDPRHADRDGQPDGVVLVVGRD